MSDLNLHLKYVTNQNDNNDMLKDNILNIFSKFSTYLSLDHNNFPFSVIATLDILPLENFQDLKDEEELISKITKPEKSIVSLIGFFKNHIDLNRLTNVNFSTITPSAFLFVNYSSKDQIEQNNKFIPIIFLNEFVNWLFSLNESKSLEIHDGLCSRITSTANENFRFCSTCSDKILIAFNQFKKDNFGFKSDTVLLPSQTDKKNEVPLTTDGSNLIQQATRPPPKRSQEIQDPNANLSFAQRKQINQMLKDVGILKEPYDAEYLETRQRFFEGKISEQVFLQILRRKSK